MFGRILVRPEAKVIFIEKYGARVLFDPENQCLVSHFHPNCSLKCGLNWHCKLAPFLIIACLRIADVLHYQSYWTNTTAGAWGQAVNWSPDGIRNAIDAVVSTAGALVITTNFSGSGSFPYIFGTLNCGSGGAAAGEISAPSSLLTPLYYSLGDVQSTNGFTFDFRLDFSTISTASMTARITTAFNPGNVYQSVCSVPMQSTLNSFPDGTGFYLKFGSYNAGGTHHLAKVWVNGFDLWSLTAFPAKPVRGVGVYYIPALQRQVSAGNYENLSIQ